MALHLFQQRMGCSRTHVWRMRKNGILKTRNYSGVECVTPDGLREFNERAERGEFAKK
jgi:hypothetical protein